MAPADTKLEIETREAIDKKLGLAGWVVQDKSRINLYASLGVAVREMDTDTGPADSMLFIGQGLRDYRSQARRHGFRRGRGAIGPLCRLKKPFRREVGA